VREIAGLVKIQGRNDPKANIFELVRDWLRGTKSGRWILVLDNVDDASFILEPYIAYQGSQQSIDTYNTLFGYLPVCEHGSILITTRSEDAAQKLVEHSDMINVGAMKNSDAVRLLEKKLGDRVDMTDVVDMATELENMPLALTQAAAYLRQMGGRWSVQKYLDKLRKSDKLKKSILDEDAGDLRRDPKAQNSIFLTWQISFEHVHKIRQSAAELLSLMSFCDRQAIPEALVRRRDSNEDPVTQQESQMSDSDDPGNSSSESADGDAVSDTDNMADDLDDAFDKDVRMLEGYSFVSPTMDPSTFEMHRLVQVATRKWLESRGQLEQWKEHYIDNLCTLFPPGRYENWSTCQIYYPHAQAAVELKPKEREALLKWATVMCNAAWYALVRVSAGDAEKMAGMSLKARAKTLGEDDEDTLSSQGMLALAKNAQGRWDEAEALQVQVMEAVKKVLGAEHPSTLTNMSNLASIYWHQGQWEEAKKLELQVMETRKKVLGAEHLDTLMSMNNLASTYWDQGRWKEAEELGVQVMKTRKKVLGAEHPSTLMSMGNLASTYRSQGRWKEAEELGVRVVETRKKVLGAEHPNTLMSMNNLASTYGSQGRWKEAEELSVRVVETMKKVLGAEHPDTLMSMNNLTSTYRNQGRLEEAEELGVRVVETMKKVLGAEHPSTLTSMGNLALTYSDKGQWDEAEQLEAQVMEMSRKVLGAEHPDTLTSMENLARTHKAQGNNKSAYALMNKCASISSRVLGMSHPLTVSRNALVEEWS
jgi:tetratricopeptide (TPR) repeat protein